MVDRWSCSFGHSLRCVRSNDRRWEELWNQDFRRTFEEPKVSASFRFSQTLNRRLPFSLGPLERINYFLGSLSVISERRWDEMELIMDGCEFPRPVSPLPPNFDH